MRKLVNECRNASTIDEAMDILIGTIAAMMFMIITIGSLLIGCTLELYEKSATVPFVVCALCSIFLLVVNVIPRKEK